MRTKVCVAHARSAGANPLERRLANLSPALPSPCVAAQAKNFIKPGWYNAWRHGKEKKLRSTGRRRSDYSIILYYGIKMK